MNTAMYIPDGKELARKLDAAVEKGFEEGLYCGIALRVLQDGETVAEVIKGVRDMDTKAPVTGDTMFRLASMTKPVTASAVLSAFLIIFTTSSIFPTATISPSKICARSLAFSRSNLLRRRITSR